jgi:hypothetical protein
MIGRRCAPAPIRCCLTVCRFFFTASMLPRTGRCCPVPGLHSRVTWPIGRRRHGRVMLERAEIVNPPAPDGAKRRLSVYTPVTARGCRARGRIKVQPGQPANRAPNLGIVTAMDMAKLLRDHGGPENENVLTRLRLVTEGLRRQTLRGTGIA